jgi:hypothetical protein
VRSGIDLTIACNQLAPTTGAQTANSLRVFPWKVHRAVTLTAVRAEVTTLIAATTFRLGIYADNGSAYPGALVAGSDVTTLDSAATGVKVNTFASAITLSPGLYWVAINNSGAPTLRAVGLGAIENVLGAAVSMGANLAITGWSVTQPYAALPSAFPVNATILLNTVAPYTLFRVQ